MPLRQNLKLKACTLKSKCSKLGDVFVPVEAPPRAGGPRGGRQLTPGVSENRRQTKDPKWEFLNSRILIIRYPPFSETPERGKLGDPETEPTERILVTRIPEIRQTQEGSDLSGSLGLRSLPGHRRFSRPLQEQGPAGAAIRTSM